MSKDREPRPVRTVAILRGRDPRTAVDLAERCWSAGVDLVEVPVQDERSWTSLREVLAVAGDRPVGAGTVTTAERAERAIDLGVAVCISPGLHGDVIAVARDAGVPVLPGVLTPTEVQAAADLGVRTCKLFPAGVLGPDYLSSLGPVFPEMGFVPTGAVGAGNAVAMVDAGAAAVAFGGALEQLLDAPSVLRGCQRISRPWILSPLAR